MVELIGIIVILVGAYVLCHMEEWKFDKRLPPPGKEVDHGAMSRDLASGMDKQSVMRKCNNGGYDVPKKR